MQVFISMKAIRGNAELEALAEQVVNVVEQSGHQALLATREITRLGLTDPAVDEPEQMSLFFSERLPA